jgi:hypothetical protein
MLAQSFKLGLAAALSIGGLVACSAASTGDCVGSGCGDTADTREDVDRPGPRPDGGEPVDTGQGDDVAVDGEGSDASAEDAGGPDVPDQDVGDVVDAAFDSTPFPDGCLPFPEICNGRDDDCDGTTDEPASGCADACCDPALVCNGGTCEPVPCDGMRCGDGSLCCEGSTVCWRDACIDPDQVCEFSADCPPGEFWEPGIGRCVPDAGIAECTYVPPRGEFAPVLGCRWTSEGLVQPERQDVVGTPIVLNLTDDNGDGLTDRRDTPDIAFLTYDYPQGCCNVAATLRVVSGACRPDGTMETLASISDVPLTNDSGIAGADLDGDGVPELVAILRAGGTAANPRPQGTVAFRRATPDGRSWAPLWQNAQYPTWDVHTRGGATISVANIDGVTGPEVVIGNVVLEGTTGVMRWDGRVTGGAAAGVGNNAFLGPAGTVADLDLDGRQEIVAGNTVYNSDGTVRWTFAYTSQNSACSGDLPCDGYNAVANFDADPQGEVVSIRRGQAFIWDTDGTQLWRANIPVADCANNESGPPTVADFDGDGVPEIGTASADYYVVLDRNTCDVDGWAAAGCQARSVLWRVPNQDCSSRATGSSVFDFDGDGRAEVVYADETSLRIFDGPTGAILFDDPTHGSHTRIEMPIIVDVDNDGNAEVVVPENRAQGGNPGIDVWEDSLDNWVRTRRIWNQHGYSITHVTEDGQIPAIPSPNWLDPRLNNFRQNAQTDDLFAAPDLQVTALDVAIEGGKCPFEVGVQVRVTVRNEGALSIPAGVPVRIELIKDGTIVQTTNLATTTRLFPGTGEVLFLAPTLGDVALAPPLSVVARVDPDNATSECREDNNGLRVDDVDCGTR